MKWSDIDGDIIHVRRSIPQKIKGGDRETPPKNKSSYRDLQEPLPLMKILEEHKERLTEDFRVCGGPVCLRETSLFNKNIQFAKEAELPVIRIHDFRYSHVSLLTNEGINIQKISRRLGHSKIETTMDIKNPYEQKANQPKYYKQSLLTKISLSSVGCFLLLFLR